VEKKSPVWKADADWAKEINVHLFGGVDVRGYSDLADLGPVRERLDANPVLFDALEEERVRRHTRV
jgi:hypothetical protein